MAQKTATRSAAQSADKTARETRKTADRTLASIGMGATGDRLQQSINELGAMAREAKKRYDSMDQTTKKKVVAGIAGAAALLAVALGTTAARTGKTRKK